VSIPSRPLPVTRPSKKARRQRRVSKYSRHSSALEIQSPILGGVARGLPLQVSAKCRSGGCLSRDRYGTADPSATLAVVISSPESGRSKPRTTTPVAAQCIAVFTKDVPTALPVVGHRMRRRVQLRAVHRIHHVVDRVAVVDLPFDMHRKFRCPALGRSTALRLAARGSS
jgi:hypothetical protein